MPVLDSIEATRLLAGSNIPDPSRSLSSPTLTDPCGGARESRLKATRPTQLVAALEAAVHGDALIDPAVTARLLSAFAATRRPDVQEPAQRLTDRDEDVLLAVARGLSNAEIAEQLFISLGT